MDGEIRRGDGDHFPAGVAEIPGEAVAVGIEVAGGAGQGAVAGEAGVEQQAAAAPDVRRQGIGGTDGGFRKEGGGFRIDGGEGVRELVEDVEAVGGEGEGARAAHGVGTEAGRADIDAAQHRAGGGIDFCDEVRVECGDPAAGAAGIEGDGGGLGEAERDARGIGRGAAGHAGVEVVMEDFPAGQGDPGEAVEHEAAVEFRLEAGEVERLRVRAPERAVRVDGEVEEMGADAADPAGEGVGGGVDFRDVMIQHVPCDARVIGRDDEADAWRCGQGGIGGGGLERGFFLGENGGAVS